MVAALGSPKDLWVHQDKRGENPLLSQCPLSGVTKHFFTLPREAM